VQPAPARSGLDLHHQAALHAASLYVAGRPVLPLTGTACHAMSRSSHIVVTILNDMSMRAHLFREMQMGFGFIQAKPATAFAPVAVTPDELGHAWHDGRVRLDMRVSRTWPTTATSRPEPFWVRAPCRTRPTARWGRRHRAPDGGIERLMLQRRRQQVFGAPDAKYGDEVCACCLV
jgi:hypothetical protein